MTNMTGYKVTSQDIVNITVCFLKTSLIESGHKRSATYIADGMEALGKINTCSVHAICD